MAATFSTGFQTTPPSDLRGAGSSPREVGLGFVAMALAMSVLVMLAGWLLLKPASGIQADEALRGAWREPGSAAQAWQAHSARAAKLPRDWIWERPAIRLSTAATRPVRKRP